MSTVIAVLEFWPIFFTLLASGVALLFGILDLKENAHSKKKEETFSIWCLIGISGSSLIICLLDVYWFFI